jgi:hypothetical protein
MNAAWHTNETTSHRAVKPGLVDYDVCAPSGIGALYPDQGPKAGAARRSLLCRQPTFVMEQVGVKGVNQKQPRSSAVSGFRHRLWLRQHGLAPAQSLQLGAIARLGANMPDFT